MKREWLIRIRESKQLTQAQVASYAFIDRGYYSQIETGKRNPSNTVAMNIAKVLDFDPLKFYHNDLNQQAEQDDSLTGEVRQFFRSDRNGEILYLYNNFDMYSKHAISFLLTGIEKGNYCLIIDYVVNINYLKEKLVSLVKQKEIEQYIYFINKEEFMNYETRDIVDYFHRLIEGFETGNIIRIWSHEQEYKEHDWLSKLESVLSKKLPKYRSNKFLFIRSYDASIVMAVAHIRMMRNYPYLMTDFEIVDSPFYQFNQSFRFPSLFIQEKM
ncbi:Helix-turn-helix [Oceanobacillus limi]|uniref:Helix-turn-helix n=1 Tax=Oceanobacillus limi TaxID=930131 RepID=A0A1I0CJ32_9BACI|nr:helix-turn-helix transcriptional regulator [Oceanobacillus limi]SET19164.1 Helix-turn-helix [Oceanobacillus limi]